MRDFSKDYKVAFQGVHGAYSEEACYKYFGEKIKTVPCSSFDEMFDKLEKNEVDYIVLPIENSTEGTVNRAHDLLLERPNFYVNGEYYLKINHCLIGNKNATIKDIKYVYSHPQALGQCKKYILKQGFKEVPYFDTAGSVLEIKGKKDCAAIASCLAAKIYDMKILDKNIQDNKSNETRFFIISKKITSGNKHSIIFKVKHEPGALLKVLECFKNINMTRLVSRPCQQNQWEYVFYMDFVYEGDIIKLLNKVSDKCAYLKYLGSYKGVRV